jgi:hypothetical protein
MLENRGKLPKSEKDHLAATQRAHVEQLLDTLRGSPQVELLEVDFPQLVADPAAGIARVRDFLGDVLQASPGVLEAVVRPDLHRHRASHSC